MTDNKQVVCQLTQQKPKRVLVIAPSELAIHHRHRQSFQTPPTLSNCIFKVIANLSIVSAMLFGISALGYWVGEIIGCREPHNHFVSLLQTNVSTNTFAYLHKFEINADNYIQYNTNLIETSELMDEPNQSDKNKFLSPHSRYYGQVKPDNLVFNANLQEFTQKVGYITCLQTNGKLAPEDAYNQIKALWKQLKRSKKTTLDW